MKKEIKVVAIVLAALIIFLSGFGIGATKGINVNVNYEGAVPAGNTTPSTTVPSTTPSTTVPSTTASDTTAAPAGDDTPDTTKAPAGDNSGSSKVPATPAEVVAAYNKAVNGAKNYKGQVHLKKDSNVAIEITDCPGGDFVRNIIQPVVNDLAGGSSSEIDFNNGEGTDAEGNTRKLYERIVPGDRDAALTEAAVSSATAVAEGDGYKMTVVIKAEESTFDGTDTVYPVNHLTILDPLNLATLDLGSITITEAKMQYAGATVEATVDGQGRLTKLVVNMPIEGSGTGKMGISATVGLAGSLDDTYVLTYA